MAAGAGYNFITHDTESWIETPGNGFYILPNTVYTYMLRNRIAPTVLVDEKISDVLSTREINEISRFSEILNRLTVYKGLKLGIIGGSTPNESVNTGVYGLSFATDDLYDGYTSSGAVSNMPVKHLDTNDFYEIKVVRGLGVILVVKFGFGDVLVNKDLLFSFLSKLVEVMTGLIGYEKVTSTLFYKIYLRLMDNNT